MPRARIALDPGSCESYRRASRDVEPIVCEPIVKEEVASLSV